jgi:hypothetical protein
VKFFLPNERWFEFSGLGERLLGCPDERFELLIDIFVDGLSRRAS